MKIIKAEQLECLCERLGAIHFMAEESRRKGIVKLDVSKLLELLNKALADERLAYYQYWIGAKVAVGPMRNAVAAEHSYRA